VTIAAVVLLISTALGSELRVVNGATTQSSSDPFEGFVIDSIEIVNRNIYDLGDERYDGFLFQAANKLHIVTRERIIRRELLLQVGDRLDTRLAAETARNLRTRFPLNEAWVEVEELSPGRVLLRVVTIDQWSLIGGLRSIDRSAGETDYRIGFEERNFLGRAQRLSFDFFARENDPDYIATSFREPRVAGWPLLLSLSYRNNPEDNHRQIAVRRPFYTLAQSYEFGVVVSGGRRTHRRYDANGDLAAEWTTSGETTDLEFAYRWGTRYKKTTFRSTYRYRWSELIDTLDADGDPATEAAFPSDSLYHQVMAGLSFSLSRFTTERRLRGFGYTEDVTLGFTAGVSYSRAFKDGFDDYHYDLATGIVAWSHKLGNFILITDCQRSIWFRLAEELRRTSTVSVAVYNNRLNFFTLAVRNLYLSDRGGGNQRLVLGGKSGLRGYPRELMAGDRMHVLNLEGRFFPRLELLSVKIGGALFSDIGSTWTSGDPLSVGRYRISAGVGLRLSLENLLKGEIIRIDVAVMEGGSVDVSFGNGQYF
jgi:hypothetical protein